MTRIICGLAALFCMLLAAPAPAQSVWSQVPISDPGCRGDITAIEYQAADRFWFATSNGQICRHVGGQFRNELMVGGVVFNDIEFNQAQVGIAVGQAKQLYRSADGGDNWTPVTLPQPNSKFSCAAPATDATTGIAPDLSHVRWAGENTVFVFGDSQQVWVSNTGGGDWSNWNRFDPNNTATNASDDACRYPGKVEDAFFYTNPDSTVGGYFTGSAGTRLLRNLANATTVNSGLESQRPQTACDDPGACVLAGDPASPARQVAIETTQLRGTRDAWTTLHAATLPNRGNRPFPAPRDLDFAGGVALAAGSGGQAFNSLDGFETAYYLEMPEAVRFVNFNAAALASSKLGAIGGEGGVLLTTDRADHLPDTVAPVIGAVSGPDSAVVGQPVTLSVSPTDEGSGVDPSAVSWTAGPGLPTLTGTTATYTFTTPGSHVVTVNAKDRSGNVAQPASKTITVRTGPSTGVKPAPTLTARVRAKSGRDRKGRRLVVLVVSGRLRLPAGVSAATGCRGKLSARAVSRSRRVARASLGLSRRCAFGKTIRILRSRVRARTITVTLEFPGNTALAGVKKSLRVRRPR